MTAALRAGALSLGRGPAMAHGLGCVIISSNRPRTDPMPGGVSDWSSASLHGGAVEGGLVRFDHGYAPVIGQLENIGPIISGTQAVITLR